MSLRQLEAKILAEARVVTGIKRLRQKDIVAWSTGPVMAEAADETVHRLPQLQVNIVIKIEPKAVTK